VRAPGLPRGCSHEEVIEEDGMIGVQYCPRRHYAKGLCELHYQRKRYARRPPQPKLPATCGCPVLRRGSGPCRRCAAKAYRQTEGRKAAKRRWKQSPAGRDSKRRCKARARAAGKAWARGPRGRRSDR